MRALLVFLIISASPAFAHHEVVMVTSFMPVLAGLATILAAVVAGRPWKRRRR